MQNSSYKTGLWSFVRFKVYLLRWYQSLYPKTYNLYAQAQARGKKLK